MRSPRGVRSLFGLAAVLLAAPTGAARTAPAPSAPPLQAETVRRVDAEHDIEVSCRVEKLDGTVVFDWHGDAPRVLASNTKLLTTSAALLELPADYRWQTVARLEEERLTLVGAGDPSIRRLPGRDVPEEFLDSLAAAVREARLEEIPTLVLDDRAFGRGYRHALWPEDQWQRDYAAGFAGLVVEGGLLHVHGGPEGLRLEPDLGAGVRVDRRLAKDASLFSAYWLSEPGMLRVNGSPRQPRTLTLAVPDPLAGFRDWLAAGLTKRGVDFDDLLLARPGDREPAGEIFWTFPSAWTLAEAVAVANLDSDNFVSEALLKTLGRVRFSRGDYEHGLRAVRTILAEAGLDVVGLAQADGSGFARDGKRGANLASPAQLCALLRLMAEHPSGQLLFDSLPIGETDRRLRREFDRPVFRPQRVHAKTGWITGASSLSGYLLAPDGTPLVFSTVVNYERDGTPRTHNRRFRKLQADVLDAILTQWPAGDGPD